MIKQLLLTLLFLTVLTCLYFFQVSNLSLETVRNNFPLLNIYVFSLLFSSTLMGFLLYASKKERFKNQLGFFFMASVFLKPLLLIIVFYGLFFGAISLTKTEAILLLMPLLVSLLFEVLFCVQLLNKINTKKKTF